MDFRHIIETNEAYNEKNLTEKDKAFIAGIRWVKDKIIDTFTANYEVTEEKDEMTTLDKIKKEIAEETLEELKTWIDYDIDELIVTTIDSYED